MNKARAMLDALMGPGRDEAVKDDGKNKEKFKDESVCKNFLVGMCPFDKDMLGGKRKFPVCEKIKSQMMRDQFEKHPEAATLRLEYEEKLLQDLEHCVRECESHVAKERTRIREDLRRKKPALPGFVNDKLAIMKRESSAMIQRAEALDDNELKEKEVLITKAAALMKEREEYQNAETQKAIDAVVPEEVCEICGVSYIGKDGDAAHLGFRVHDAYVRIRAKIAELRPKFAAKEKAKLENGDVEQSSKTQAQKKASRSRDRRHHSREKGREKEKEKGKEKEKEKETEKAKEGDKHKAKRDGERRPHRSRSRAKHGGDRRRRGRSTSSKVSRRGRRRASCSSSRDRKGGKRRRH